MLPPLVADVNIASRVVRYKALNPSETTDILESYNFVVQINFTAKFALFG